ncbi:hypothetical protein J2S43_006820 [Catenuloplanes nepalensis]|uniref:Uncharacterized protein n=1 Tax=Catenuloplanes nepalensis TaxID=587533 RepID=A0ABT9N3M5_9ACTN|nr:hypothetical protein [Catenuloplanes nepalensis]MDP9798308.1 hypothetical protein [Catenuloplanes nepalensis]
MARKNVNRASGNDSVDIQVGRVAESRTSKDKSKDKPTPGESGEMRNTNVTRGNARVGVQADTVSGPIVIRF